MHFSVRMCIIFSWFNTTLLQLSSCTPICLWLCSPLLDLGHFSDSWSFTRSVVFLGRGISQSQGRYLHTGQHKHRINAHWYPCLKWDSNPRSQCLSERRQFMPYTARPPWSVHLLILFLALQPWPLFQFHDHFYRRCDQLVARPLPKYRKTQTQNKHIHTPNIHTSSGIRTHDRSVWEGEDISCLALCEIFWS
jgi:hypothetical protein